MSRKSDLEELREGYNARENGVTGITKGYVKALEEEVRQLDADLERAIAAGTADQARADRWVAEARHAFNAGYTAGATAARAADHANRVLESARRFEEHVNETIRIGHFDPTIGSVHISRIELRSLVQRVIHASAAQKLDGRALLYSQRRALEIAEEWAPNLGLKPVGETKEFEVRTDDRLTPDEVVLLYPDGRVVTIKPEEKP